MRKEKQQTGIAIVLFGIFFLLYCGFTFWELLPESDRSTIIAGNFLKKIGVVEKQTAIFTGDIMLARDVEEFMQKSGPDHPYVRLGDVLEGDVVFGNFEASMRTPHLQTQDMMLRFSVAEAYIEPLSAAGFTHMTLANNHSFDYGVTGYEQSIQSLEKANITSFGSEITIATSSLEFFTLNDLRVAVLAVNMITEDFEMAPIESLLSYAEKMSDMQIIYVHWGEEYQLVHNATQEKFAHFLVDVGADAVIGHHPHVVQDIEKYKNVPIFYSLGNFIFDQYFSKEVQEGLVLSLEFDEKIPVFTMLPVSSVGHRVQPKPMSKEATYIFLQELAKRSDTSIQEAVQEGTLRAQSLAI